MDDFILDDIEIQIEQISEQYLTTLVDYVFTISANVNSGSISKLNSEQKEQLKQKLSQIQYVAQEWELEDLYSECTYLLEKIF